MRKSGILALSAGLFYLAPPSGGVAQENGPCEGQGSEIVRVLGFDENFDIKLADGRSVTLPGVEFRVKVAPQAANSSSPVLRWLARVNDQSPQNALLKLLTGASDRWGRVAARLSIASPAGNDGQNEGRPVHEDLAQGALAAGLGVYRPDALARACRSVLLAAEQRARVRGLGIWGPDLDQNLEPNDAPAPVIKADDRQAVASAGPGLTLVEGKIVGIGETAGRIYLNFGEIRGVDLALTISKRNRAVMRALALEAGAIVGRSLRARGLIDRRFGPQMEINTADALELIP